MDLHTLQQLENAKREVAETQAEIKALPKEWRVCHYRECHKSFDTDDKRMQYCCREHYKLENKARTMEKDEAKRQQKRIDTDKTLSV